MDKLNLQRVALLFFGLALFCPMLSVGQEADSLAQKRDTTAQSRDTTGVEGGKKAVNGRTGKEEKGTLRSIKEKTGFFLDLNAGYSYRFNSFQTRRPLLEKSPVGYSSLSLGVYDLSVNVGLVGTSVLDFNYESPYPQTNFQEKALAARENRTKGLEKYTAGINVLPLWRFVVPKSWPDFIKWLPAFEIRYTRELTQNTAIAKNESILLNSVDNIAGTISLEDLTFQRVSKDESFSFKTLYQYGSVSIPVYVWNWEDRESHTALRLGVSRWSYSRVYSTRFPKFNTPIVYKADAAGRGLLLSFHSLPRKGFRTKIVTGIGSGQFETNNRDLSGALPFFYETGDTSANPLSLYAEGDFSYRFSFFPESSVTMYLEPGVDVDVFNVSFNSFGDVVTSANREEGEVLRKEESSSIQHFDFIILPWVRFSLSI
jgi:hypothetical protein